MAFQAWAFFIFISSIVALNHRFGKTWDDEKHETERRRARTRARLARQKREEAEAHEAARKKRKEARAKRAQEQERLAEIRADKRRWIYGQHSVV
ncbi:hypothetical protein LTR78_006266 [Recurvomyces mirabilis]|uniref:Uncharacterized protein n=1 Tax=Recurvomyces mirabilis TaxID=574656 RepID=A0AAE0WL35_9PEZI|nr:hypothetical protein LTR78_006266 [Recurvomyces mirabilis]KAK5152155.1 hypothetical protein LTS14_008530 [Recurvomyces mirabilis]